MMLRLPLVSVTPIVVLLQVLGNHLATSAEPRTDTALPVVLATRGKLILDDDGSKDRGGKTTSTFDSGVKVRAGAGTWNKVDNSNIWRSTWNRRGHVPVMAYQGITSNNLVIEVTFRYGSITEDWQHQCFRIAVDQRPKIVGHVVSAWANPNNDFIESGFLLQHIRKTPTKEIIEDLLLDHQPLKIKAEKWYTAILEVVDDEALFRMDNHIAYAQAEEISLPKNLVSLTMGSTWHEIKRVRIWEAAANPDWKQQKTQVLKPRLSFSPQIHNYQPQ